MAMQRIGWFIYALALAAQFVLSTILTLARSKAIPLPCGSALGCATSIYKSPSILGLHLTEYALIYSVVAIASLSILVLLNINQRPWLVLIQTVGFLGSTASNGYNYIINDTLCPYCMTFWVLSFFTLGCVLILDPKAFRGLRQDFTTVIVSGSLAMSLSLLWFQNEIKEARRTGAVTGISASELVQGGSFVLGRPSAKSKVICFYNPTCQVCKDEITRFREAVSGGADVYIHLRAKLVESEDVTRRQAAALVSLSRTTSAVNAVGVLIQDNNQMRELLGSTRVEKQDFDEISADMQLAKALDITRTPTCILVTGNVAKYVPCDELPFLLPNQRH